MPSRTNKPAVQKTARTTRSYVVVKVVSGDTLKVLDPERQARSQDEAINKLLATLKPEERNGCFGAFLTGSYRERNCSTRQEFVTDSRERSPSFFKTSASAAS